MTIVTTAYKVSAAVTKRQKVEKRIAARAVADLLNAGYVLAVAMGDEYPEATTTDKKTVMLQLGECDEDRLMVYQPDHVPPDGTCGNDYPPYGWVHLVYGNDGWDVISDYTLNLEGVLASAVKMAEEISEGV